MSVDDWGGIGGELYEFYVEWWQMQLAGDGDGWNTIGRVHKITSLCGCSNWRWRNQKILGVWA